MSETGDMELFLFARFHARPGCEASLRDAIREVTEPTRQEPGCISYRAFQSVRERGEFYIHSRWRNREAFDVHASLQHTEHFISIAETLIDHPLSVSLTVPME